MTPEQRAAMARSVNRLSALNAEARKTIERTKLRTCIVQVFRCHPETERLAARLPTEFHPQPGEDSMLRVFLGSAAEVIRLYPRLAAPLAESLDSEEAFRVEVQPGAFRVSVIRLDGERPLQLVDGRDVTLPDRSLL